MKLRVPPTEKNFPGYKIAPQVYTTTSWEQLSYIAMTLSETLRIACKAGLLRVMSVSRQTLLYPLKVWKTLHTRVDRNSVMSKRYVLNVEVDEHGECFLTLPDELLDEMGWAEGTELDWSEDIDGTVILKKLES